MEIITGKTLYNQNKEFVDLVSNVKSGNIYLRRYTEFLVKGHVCLYFLVDSVEEITTRFGSRDRILRGYKCRIENNELIKMESESVWCSKLKNTENLKSLI